MASTHLAVGADHGHFGAGLDWIRRPVVIETGVRCRMEDVQGLNGRRARLLVAKDQVDPVLEIQQMTLLGGSIRQQRLDRRSVDTAPGACWHPPKVDWTGLYREE